MWFAMETFTGLSLTILLNVFLQIFVIIKLRLINVLD